MFDIEDYNYELPARLIAQAPASRRDGSRLLVVDRAIKAFSDRFFFDLPDLLKPGDLLVANNTKVVPARLIGRKETGGRCEILVLEHTDSNAEGSSTRSCLVKSSKRPKKGSLLFFDSDVCGQVKEISDNGIVKITFNGNRSIDCLLEEKGYMPLPPYIKRGDDSSFSVLDRERYQTVFSEKRGAVAAPTAGLHFTEGLMEKLETAGISISYLTLHVGYGTFRPVRTRDVRKHNLGLEHYRIGPETVEAIERTRKKGGKVVAVGTTVVRALETAAVNNGSIVAGAGKTDLLITPGFSFKVVDKMITNFHLPKSSLLFLVSAFAGLELVKDAYKSAVEKEYRFYSYGDAMLIL
ncbi:MAG: tRNA preQ1(34) S-adenosylmethionine ribosyltransferase-isomerase QueA [Thermodesulfobacteriota bacterium]|nr:tRNA preQ1(34) S-adenosylmethionine ribosyltransferase-isomerase QueA [Thermodesulfobacteriota bacterium]